MYYLERILLALAIYIVMYLVPSELALLYSFYGAKKQSKDEINKNFNKSYNKFREAELYLRIIISVSAAVYLKVIC